jgi:arylsulfatase A-like enzyme
VEPDPEPRQRPARLITQLTKRNFDWATLDRPETDWPDRKVADWAAGFLAKKHEKPFFLAVGFFRPHVPWYNPRDYVERFPLEKIKLPSVKENDLDDLGPWAKARAHDHSSKHDKVVEFSEWKPAVQAYLASISFCDAMLGRVLDALDAGPNARDTIIVFWSDHGYHLGEKGHWHKRTLWERSTRVPLIIVAPGVTRAGTRCARPVSLLDLYPTLADLCDLPKRAELEGQSLRALLKNPKATWIRPAVVTWQKGNHAVRSDRWRYIRYRTGEEELYDHQNDPNEWNNLAHDPKRTAIRNELAKWLPANNSKSK